MNIKNVQNLPHGAEYSMSEAMSLYRAYGRAGTMFAAMMGSSSGAGSTTGAGGSGSGSSGGSTFVTPSALASLLGDIPIADDGDVITADYHNSLRDALLALAAFLGQGAVAETQMVTVPPALIPYDVERGHNTGSWLLQPTGAIAHAGLLAGWLAVDLPDGVQLQQFSVVNSRRGDLNLDATLSSVPLATPTSAPTVLAEVAVHGGNGTVRTDSAPIRPAGSTDPTLIASLGRIDNSTYRYFIEAKTKAEDPKGAGNVLATIYAFQINYSLS
jgi:hypothetical protein